MSNAIRDSKGNSLSPEPCALIPDVAFPSHSQLVGRRLGRTLRTAHPANGMGASR